MADDLPDPLVPPDCDLRDFPFTPLFRARLFGSSFHARSTDAEWRAGVTLWLKSWDQVPAGTLPDDDIDLCRLAELGRDLKAWAKVKQGAMRGWAKCSDGRLHHSVVAEGVLDAWERRQSAKRKGQAGASKRWSADKAQPSDANGASNSTAIAQASVSDGPAIATTIAGAMPSDSNRQGQGQGESSSLRSDGGKPPPEPLDPKTVLWRDGLATVKRLAKVPDGPARKLLGKMLDAIDADHAALLQILQQTETHQPDDPVAWIRASIAQRKNPALLPAHGGEVPADPSGIHAYIAKCRKDPGAGIACVNGFEVETIADQIVMAIHAAGGQMVAKPGWHPLEEWLKADLPLDGERFLGTIRRVASSVDGPIRSMQLFDAALRSERVTA